MDFRIFEDYFAEFSCLYCISLAFSNLKVKLSTKINYIYKLICFIFKLNLDNFGNLLIIFAFFKTFYIY